MLSLHPLELKSFYSPQTPFHQVPTMIAQHDVPENGDRGSSNWQGLKAQVYLDAHVSVTVSFLLSIGLIGFSALFSGLTLGLISLSVFELKRKAELGDKDALAVYPIRQRGSELLVALLVGNVLVNAALTVVLNSILAGFFAVLVSTVLITAFGEILPQALLKKHGLKFGAKLAPGINGYLKAMRWLSVPVSRLLDVAIGDEEKTVYTKEELLKIMDEHEGEDSEIEDEDLSIAKHALSFADKRIEDVMLPRNQMLALAQDDVLSPALLTKLYENEDSAFAVYKGTLDNIVGTLFMRDVVNVDKQKMRVSELMDPDVFYVKFDQTLDHVLSAFLRTKHHVFVVIDRHQNTLGVVTIDDIVDEVMGTKFVDHFDAHHDKAAVSSIKGRVK